MAKGRGLGKGLDSLISGGRADQKKDTPSSKDETKSSRKDTTIDRSDHSVSGDGSGEESSAKPASSAKPVSSATASTSSAASAAAPGAASAANPASETGEPLMMRISSIEPNRDQPRKDFDEEALQELASSIKKYGILQPLLVRKVGKRYEIIAGERRWRAAKLARLKEVPVIIKEFTDGEATEIALIENIQREDLNPVEEAEAYQRLMDEFFLTQEQVAERVGKSRTAIANRVRLLKLAPEVRELLVSGKITEGHARALITLETPELQIAAAKEVADRGLTVRETEKLVKHFLAPPAPPKKPEFTEADILAYEKLEEELRYSTGTKVEIHRSTKNRGKIVLDYYSMEELERLADMFRRLKEI